MILTPEQLATLTTILGEERATEIEAGLELIAGAVKARKSTKAIGAKAATAKDTERIQQMIGAALHGVVVAPKEQETDPHPAAGYLADLGGGN